LAAFAGAPLSFLRIEMPQETESRALLELVALDTRDYLTRLTTIVDKTGDDPAAVRALLREIRTGAGVHAERLRLVLAVRSQSQ
jgi:hypothetical protein